MSASRYNNLVSALSPDRCCWLHISKASIDTFTTFDSSSYSVFSSLQDDDTACLGVKLFRIESNVGNVDDGQLLRKRLWRSEKT